MAMESVHEEQDECGHRSRLPHGSIQAQEEFNVFSFKRVFLLISGTLERISPKGSGVAQRKQEEKWVPITARVSPDSAVRLRVNAARRGIPFGRVLDELIQAGLQPEKPLRGPGRTPRATAPWTIDRLARALEDLGINQAAFSRELKLSQKAINNWFLRGEIPPGRQMDIEHAVAALRKAQKKPEGPD